MRILSSPLTVVMKFVLPGTVTLVLGASALAGFLMDDDGRWTMLVVFVVASTLLWSLFSDLKRVELLDDTLLVSNHFRQVEVPLRAVTAVRPQLYPVNTRVILELERDFGLGTTVRFIPNDSTGYLDGASPEGPVIQELREAVERARRRSA